MSYVEEMLEYNKKFVEGRRYKLYPATKYPSKKIVILSCMDARLTEILPAALNFKNGDVQIITNAGAVISHPFGSVMRSLLLAVYELGVEDILVIGHQDCGMQGMKAPKLLRKMTDRGIKKERVDFISSCGIDINKWLKGFDKVEESVPETVGAIRHHPFIPADVRVHGFVISPITGGLEKIG